MAGPAESAATPPPERCRRLAALLADPDRRWPLLLLAVAVVVTARSACYVIGEPLGGWDMPTILARLAETRFADVLGWFSGVWVQQNPYYRPLVSVSLWLDYHLLGPQHPALWRLENLIYYAIVAVLWAGLARELTGSELAGFVAGVCTVNGQVDRQIIVFVAPRTDLLCGLFLVLGARFAVRYARETGRRPLAATLVAVALALGCKELGLSSLMLLPVTAFVAGARPRELAKLTGALLLLLLVYWQVRALALHHPWLKPAMDHTPFGALTYWQYVLEQLFPLLLSRGYYASWAPIMLLVAHDIARPLTEALFLFTEICALRRPRLLLAVAVWIIIPALMGAPYARIAVHYGFLPTLAHALWLGGGAAVLEPAGRRWLARRFPALTTAVTRR